MKTLHIDADHLIYNTIYSPRFVDGVEGETLNVAAFKEYKTLFKQLLHNVVSTCELESSIGDMIPFKGYKCWFTGHTNFRYDIFPDYKKQRVGREKPEMFYKLKDWAAKKYSGGPISDLVEADDIVCYYARKGHPIVSADKDVLNGTPGYHWNNYAKKFMRVTEEEAREFRFGQYINGDLGDDIPGIRTPEDLKPLTKANPKGFGAGARVGPVKAFNLLNGDFTLKNVLQIYSDYNFDVKYAIVQIRLIDVDPIKKITKKGKIVLWKFNKNLDKI